MFLENVSGAAFTKPAKFCITIILFPCVHHMKPWKILFHCKNSNEHLVLYSFFLPVTELSPFFIEIGK